MALQAILLDLDGTIWDSYPFYASLIAELCSITAEEALLELQSGTSIVQLLNTQGLGNSRFIKLCKVKADTLKLYPSVVETIGELHDRYSMAVVTNLPGWITNVLLESAKLLDSFDYIQTATRGIPSKPRPHLIRRALNQLSINDPKDAIYVGDTEGDYAAACAAGTGFVWCEYGYEKKELNAQKISNFKELSKL